MKAWMQRNERGWRASDGGLKTANAADPQSAIISPPASTGGRNPQSGFTLIELMLVLVILATLAAIVTPRLTGQSKRAKVIAAQAQIADFGTALDAFEIACGRYPTTTEGMLALLQAPADLPDWNGPYLNRNTVPLDPWGNEYQYRCPGQYNPDGYDLYCFGPDGRQGGDDDISNWSEEVRR